MCPTLRVVIACASFFAYPLLCVGADLRAGELAYDRGDYATALKEWLPIAEQGGPNLHSLPDLYFLIGATYAHEGATQNYTEAARWYRKASEQGHRKAQYWLGVALETGVGIPQDYKEALKWYRNAADQGFADAQYAMGRMYANGSGLRQNYVEAAQWYLQAAAQNHVGSQNALCGMYLLGRGVRQDYSEAASWCKKSANQGDPDAQTILAGFYAIGKGVPQDYVLALMWVLIAEPNGGQKAIDVRKGIESVASQDQISLAQELARKWQPPAANSQPSANSGIASIRSSGDPSIAEGGRQVSPQFEKLRKYLDAEMLDDAIREIQRLAEANEFDPELHFALGEVYFRKGNFEEAIRQFTTSKKLDGHMWQATERLADSNLRVWETGKDQTSRIAACSLYEEIEHFDGSHATISAFSQSNDLAKAKVRASETARRLESPEGLWATENGDQYSLYRKDSTWHLSGPMLLATLEESAGGLLIGHGSNSVRSCVLDLNIVVRLSDCATSMSVEGIFLQIVGAVDKDELRACTYLLGGTTGMKMIEFKTRRLK